MRAILLIAEGFEDSEFYYPYYRLREEGIEVDVAGPEIGLVTGKHGYTFRPNRTFADLDPARYDLLVIPGGRGPETVRLSESAVTLTRELVESGKLVASICHGTQVLISAGVMPHRRATSWKGIRDDLRVAGADYLDEEVVVDGNLITSRCPDDLPAFCREIFLWLREKYPDEFGVKAEYGTVGAERR